MRYFRWNNVYRNFGKWFMGNFVLYMCVTAACDLLFRSVFVVGKFNDGICWRKQKKNGLFDNGTNYDVNWNWMYFRGVYKSGSYRKPNKILKKF